MLLSANDFQAVTYNAKPSVRVYGAAANTIDTGFGTFTALIFDTEVYDRWEMHNTSSNTERLVVKIPGIYILAGAYQLGANATGRRAIYIEHYNSSDVRRALLSSQLFDAPSTGVAVLSSSTVSLVAAVDDYFVLKGAHDAGVTLTVAVATADLQQRRSFAAVWHSRG